MNQMISLWKLTRKTNQTFTRHALPSLVRRPIPVCGHGHGITRTTSPGAWKWSIPASPARTAIAPTTARTSLSVMPVASPTSRSACTPTSTASSCQPASPALAAILTSCGGAATPRYHPLSKPSSVAFSSRSAHPQTSTSTLTRTD